MSKRLQLANNFYIQRILLLLVFCLIYYYITIYICVKENANDLVLVRFFYYFSEVSVKKSTSTTTTFRLQSTKKFNQKKRENIKTSQSCNTKNLIQSGSCFVFFLCKHLRCLLLDLCPVSIRR